jgi:D-alanyl-D-alanine endopeptidase (penicillin-binding protein 7)
MQAVNQAPTNQVWNGLPTAKYVDMLPGEPIKKNETSYGIETSAKSAIVIDAGTGKVLFENDADKKMPMASLTKLMTVMVFLDQTPNLDEEVTIQPKDEPEENIKSMLEPGDKFTKRELLQVLLVASSNQAGNALARSSMDPDEFVRLMNKKAKELNLKNTQFTDPTGYDPKNVSTAKDVAMMMREAAKYPEVQSVTPQNQTQIKGRVTKRTYLFKSTNLLLTSFLNKAPYQVTAGKTGTLPEAGFCFAQTTKNKEGNAVISVVLGSDNHFSRFQDVKGMTYWAFENYEWPKKTVAGK